jgi:hypothetical protein
MLNGFTNSLLFIGFHGLGLCVYRSSTSVQALSQFLLHIFLLSPFDLASSQVFVYMAVVNTTWVVH